MDDLKTGHLRSRAALYAAIVVVLAGCESLGTTKKVSNPVVPPPPQTRLIGKRGTAATRPTGNETSAGGDRAGHGQLASGGSQGERTARLASHDEPHQAAKNVETVSHSALAAESDPEDIRRTAHAARTTKGWKSATDGKGAQSAPLGDKSLAAWQSKTEIEGAGETYGKGEVAATVNGAPIFVDDVLMPFAYGLAQAQQQLPPDEFRKLRAAQVKKFIQPHIEQELLLQALRTKVKDDQLSKIKEHIDAQFDTELAETMRRLGVSTSGELEIELRKKGSSIDTLRTAFRNRQLAQQFLSTKTSPRSGFDRPDVVQHYHEHRNSYAVPGQVKWQQIQLTYARNGGRRETTKLAEKLLERLERGDDFAKLAKEYSDGATASKGGHWDWTRENSLASKELDQALFEMPVGEEITMIEGDKAIDIVWVLDRRESGFKSFESVQLDIKNELKMNEFKRSVKALLAELTEQATIEMHTDSI